MSIKEKLVLDAAVAALLIMCMEYDATGYFIHELIGVILLIGLITHAVINIRYYRILGSGKIKKLNVKNKILLILNILLPVSIVTMVSSSVIISKEIFRFLNIDTSHYEVWRILHIISACVMLVTAFIHILMHIKMFSALVKKKAGEKYSKETFRAVSFAAAVIAGSFVIKTTSGYISENLLSSSADESKEHQFSQPVLTQKREETVPEYTVTTREQITENILTDPQDEITEIITESVEEEPVISETVPNDDKPTLEEFLRPLTCNGCGKHCSLLAPSCGKGEMQAESATEEYYNTYGIN